MTLEDKIVAKYIRKIHPEDLGTETSLLEMILREMLEEYGNEFLKTFTTKITL